MLNCFILSCQAHCPMSGLNSRPSDYENEGSPTSPEAWFPLSQLRPRQRPISSQNKATSVKDDCSTV